MERRARGDPLRAPAAAVGCLGMDALTDGDDGGDDRGDWLTANVWSPRLDGRLPVMVWVQGGAYLWDVWLPEYNGSTLARGGVVVVTFNYRVR